MAADWSIVAERVASALALQPGMLVQVRERSGRYEVMEEILLAIERLGATPLPEILPPDYAQRLLATTDPGHLEGWDRHRRDWIARADRLLVLADGHPDLESVSPEALSAWRRATARIDEIEERLRVPFVLVAIPTESRAARLGTTLAQLEATLLPALAVPPTELRAEIDRLLPVIEGARRIAIGSAGDAMLEIDIAGRRWHSDAGVLPAEVGDVQPVINLPAGSVYTTVVEDSARGRLVLPEAGGARDAVFDFAEGRAVSITASEGADALVAVFDGHSGEPRRISHIGIGLNPRLREDMSWPLVGEHRHGSIFIAFGENRYLGGENASSLNIDFVLPRGSLLVDGRSIVEAGRVVV